MYENSYYALLSSKPVLSHAFQWHDRSVPDAGTVFFFQDRVFLLQLSVLALILKTKRASNSTCLSQAQAQCLHCNIFNEKFRGSVAIFSLIGAMQCYQPSIQPGRKRLWLLATRHK